MRRNKKKKIIIISLIGILILMTVGYAAFQTNLNIKGTSSISSNWDIIISNIEKVSYGGEAEEAKIPTGIGTLTADMEVNLYQKGDYIEYDVTVLNRGTIDAVLSNIRPAEREYIDPNNQAIKISFSGVNINDKLYKRDTHHLKVRLEYNPDFTGTPKEGSVSLEIGLEYTQAEMAGTPTLNPNLYVSSKGDDTKGNGSKSNPYLTLSKAYKEAGENSTIYIMDDITQTETLNLNEDKNITITSDGNAHKILRANSGDNHLINIFDGKVTLKNIVVDGNKVDMEYGLIGLNNECYLTLDNNVTLTNAIANYWNGGAIRFNDGSTAILEINDATISNNEAYASGAIHIVSGGTVIMNSGLITGNKTLTGGGGAITNYGTLIIRGGIISNNSSKGYGGAIFQNKGLYNNTSTTIENATIINNEAQNSGGGLSIWESEIKISGTTKINNNKSYGHGGGIYLENGANAIIENAIIDANKAINANGGYYSGGGIIIHGNSVLTLNDGIISNNYASNTGGGIRVYNGELIMNGGVIKKNTTDGDGGGIEVHGEKNKVNKFTMNGGQIINNTARNTGGGVDVGEGTYIHKSGIVCGNTPTNSYETHATCPSS